MDGALVIRLKPVAFGCPLLSGTWIEPRKVMLAINE
jgi:hypothetical protein